MTDFRFTHERVRGITTTDENGTETTYIAVQDLTGDLGEAIAMEIFKHTFLAMQGSEGLDPKDVSDETLDSVEAVFRLSGMGEAYSLVHRFADHMGSVSTRLQAGLPAHAGDEPDPEAVETAVAEFAEALADVTPEDFKE